MYLLNTRTHELEYFEGSRVPQYAILSHTWGKDEVLYKDVVKRRHKAKQGWQKIRLCCEQAINDYLDYVWVDTCCIDKKSSAELSEAINSMYAWYRGAKVCYAYLVDVGARPKSKIHKDRFFRSRWFLRGWTLQELLAPSFVDFYDGEWNFIGSRDSELADRLEQATGISRFVLTHSKSPSDCSVAERMSWAAKRATTRVEDRAYSLLGLFDVNMPLIYGEGHKAFQRLLAEIMSTSNDLNIFASVRHMNPAFGMLPASPSSFATNLACDADLGSSYQVDKNGIRMIARLHPYCMDISVLEAGSSMGQISLGLFLQYQPSTPPSWQRVRVDRKTLLAMPYSETHLWSKKANILVTKSPLFDTESKTLERLRLFSRWTCTVRPVQLSYVSQRGVLQESVCNNQCQNLVVTRGKSTGIACILLTWRPRYGIADYKQALLHMGFRPDGPSTVFLRWLDDDGTTKSPVNTDTDSCVIDSELGSRLELRPWVHNGQFSCSYPQQDLTKNKPDEDFQINLGWTKITAVIWHINKDKYEAKIKFEYPTLNGLNTIPPEWLYKDDVSASTTETIHGSDP